MPTLRRRPLAPRLRDRFGAALRPGWARSMLVRRLAATVLVIAALALGVTAQTGGTDAIVLVAARELTPGRPLTDGDVTTRSVPGSLAPPGALTDPATAVGRLSTGVIGSGEIVTEVRLLSAQLPAALIGRADARLVPVPLADSAVAGLLRPGDVVDVVTEEGRVLARRAVVALPAAAEGAGALGGGGSSAPALLAMDEAAAHRVAASSLTAALAVVVH